MSAIYAQNQLVLAEVTQAATTTTGSTHLPIPKVDADSDDDQSWWAVFEVTQVGTGTVDAVVEGSWDGTTWHTLATMTQLAAAGLKAEVKTISIMPPKVRGKVTCGASATFTGIVRLASNKGWQNGVAGASA